MRPPAATGYVSPNDIRIPGSIGNRNFPSPFLLTFVYPLPSRAFPLLLPTSPSFHSLRFRNYNKCHSIRDGEISLVFGNGVTEVSSFFFLFLPTTYYPCPTYPPCTRVVSSRFVFVTQNSRSCSTRSRDREERERERSIEGKGCESA